MEACRERGCLLPDDNLNDTNETPGASDTMAGQARPRERFYHSKALEEDRNKILYNWELSIANDLPTNTKKEIKAYMALRDGQICTYDGRQIANIYSMDIHHIVESKPKDWHRWNLCLMEHPCNSRLNNHEFNERRRREIQGLQYHEPASSRLDQEREKAPRPRDSDPFSNKKFAEAGPYFRKYVFVRIFHNLKSGEKSSRKEVALEGCIKSGLQPEAGDRHMEILCDTKFSPLIEDLEKNEVSFREPEYNFLNVDDMMKLFPLGGLRLVDEKWREQILEDARDQMRERDLKRNSK